MASADRFLQQSLFDFEVFCRLLDLIQQNYSSLICLRNDFCTAGRPGRSLGEIRIFGSSCRFRCNACRCHRPDQDTSFAQPNAHCGNIGRIVYKGTLTASC